MTTQWHAKRGYDGTTVERGVLGAALTAGGRGIDFYDTDTSTWYKWDGAAWGAFGPGADHGLLSGLADDDHLQYIFNAPTASTRNVIEPTGPTIRPLAIELAAAQSANAFEVLVQGGATILSSINSSGNFNVSPVDTAGTNVAFATKQTYSDATHSYCFRGDLLHNTALNVGAIQGVRVSIEKRGTGDVTSLAGGNFAVQIGNQSPAIAAYYGIIGQSSVAAGATPTINNVYNLFFAGTLRAAIVNNAYGILTNPGSISTGSITNAYGGRFTTGKITAAGTITHSYGVRIASGTIHGTGTLTNLYGLYINNMNAAATLNYAILTNAGNVWLNAGLDPDTDLIVSGDTVTDLLKTDAGNDQVETHGGRIEATTRIVVGDSPYTTLNTDHVIFCDTDGGAITVDLQVGVEGRNFKIINVGTSGNDVTVDGNAGETVYGALTAVLADGEVISIHYNATEGWW